MGKQGHDKGQSLVMTWLCKAPGGGLLLCTSCPYTWGVGQSALVTSTAVTKTTQGKMGFVPAHGLKGQSVIAGKSQWQRQEFEAAVHFVSPASEQREMD